MGESMVLGRVSRNNGASGNKRVDRSNGKLAQLFERATRSIEKGANPCHVLDEEVDKQLIAISAPADADKLCCAFERLVQSVREREQEQHDLVATAAHDLRTPLFIINGASHALKNPDLSAEDREYYLDCIRRNTVSLQVLVEDFNDDIRARAGRLEMRREKVDVCELARQTVHDFSSLAPRNPIYFEGEGSCCVLGDEERLKRMLFNLLSNAVKSSKEGREVSVNVWRHGTRACLMVQDEGKGVPPAETERLFLPYTRLDGSCHMTKGDGLGLHSVKIIADAHGAEINVQGTPGRGTTFEVNFNLYEGQNA
jgi:two-component system phosphate regulon sensor histidine kinase PhoR